MISFGHADMCCGLIELMSVTDWHNCIKEMEDAAATNLQKKLYSTCTH